MQCLLEEPPDVLLSGESACDREQPFQFALPAAQFRLALQLSLRWQRRTGTHLRGLTMYGPTAPRVGTLVTTYTECLSLHDICSFKT